MRKDKGRIFSWILIRTDNAECHELCPPSSSCRPYAHLVSGYNRYCVWRGRDGHGLLSFRAGAEKRRTPTGDRLSGAAALFRFFFATPDARQADGRAKHVLVLMCKRSALW